MNQLAEATLETEPTEDIAGIPSNAGLHARLCCPACDTNDALVQKPYAALRCPSCAMEFPEFVNGDASIPWLFSAPDSARLEWSSRYRGFLKTNADRYNRLNRALNDGKCTPAARRRIKETLSAHREHRNQVAELLEPVGLDADDLVPAMTQVMQDKLPKNQGLLSYADNVFRDWAWNNGENDALFDAIDTVLRADRRDTIGAVLTLGAGACRIPYDLHRRYAPTLSVALDINPLLLLIGSQVIGGRPVSLYEFPIAPLDESISGVLQNCSAPVSVGEEADSRFEFVLGDATNPPFARHSFDTVVTPWLIDILPEDLREFVPQVNRLLPKDGVWVSTGSLAFIDSDPCRCYSESEVVEIVEQNGFELLAIDHRTVPYLQSPYSAHGRVERIVTFAAKKRSDVEPVTPVPTLPAWILDTTRSVPSSTETILASSSYLLTAQVLAAVDGKRSINAIGKLVAGEYGLSMDECIHAIRRILMEADQARPDSP